MEQLKAFWFIVVDVWKEGLWGVDLGRFILAALIIVGFLLVRRLFAKVVISRLAALTKRTKTPLDDEVLEVLDKPVAFIPVVIGLFIAAEYLPLSGIIETITNNLIRSLIVFVIFWCLVKLVKTFSSLLRGLESI